MYSPETAMARYAGHIYSLEHSQRWAYLAISNKQIPVSGTSSYYRLNNKCIDMCQMTGITVDLLWAFQEGGMEREMQIGTQKALNKPSCPEMKPSVSQLLLNWYSELTSNNLPRLSTDTRDSSPKLWHWQFITQSMDNVKQWSMRWFCLPGDFFWGVNYPFKQQPPHDITAGRKPQEIEFCRTKT